MIGFSIKIDWSYWVTFFSHDFVSAPFLVLGIRWLERGVGVRELAKAFTVARCV